MYPYKFGTISETVICRSVLARMWQRVRILVGYYVSDMMYVASYYCIKLVY